MNLVQQQELLSSEKIIHRLVPALILRPMMKDVFKILMSDFAYHVVTGEGVWEKASSNGALKNFVIN